MARPKNGRKNGRDGGNEGGAMRIAELVAVLERLAPASLAEPNDNCGLLIGSEDAPVRRLLVALELTPAALKEARSGGYDTILTHHPVLFTPVRRLVDSRPDDQLIRGLIVGHFNLIACHTNLDAAPGGLAEIAGEGLGLEGMAPLQRSYAGWYKLVGFIPHDAVEAVAAAVFAAGGGGIGNYKECAYSVEGRGWFTPLQGAHPAVGEVARPERTPEVRWETVVPRAVIAKAIAAYVVAHPYEEPAFDIYPVEDVWARAGLGRAGSLTHSCTVAELAAQAMQIFGLSIAKWTDGTRVVARVGVVPGSGRNLVDAALSASCDVFITGDLGYHEAERAAAKGLSLIDVPHGDLEWWAFRRWCEGVAPELAESGVAMVMSEAWQSPWESAPRAAGDMRPPPSGRPSNSPRMRLWIDGGSRGNPGPSAIGVVLEAADGSTLETISRAIGTGTNNAAEYRALLAGLEIAVRAGARRVEVLSDSELLVKQMLGQYRVKNAGLKPLHEQALQRAQALESFTIRHVSREENTRADSLVNQALDERT